MNTDQFVCQFPVVPDSLNSLVTQVILIRHGLSTFNQQGRMQGSSDESRLTEHGRRTARQVGQWLHGVAIDAVYSSPLQRAHATAEEIVGQMSSSRSIPLYTDSRLREVDLPAWEGRSFQHIRTLFSEDYRCWKQRPHQLQMETFSASTALSRSLEQSMGVTQAVATLAPERRFPALDLYDRAMQFWQDILPGGWERRWLLSVTIVLTMPCSARRSAYRRRSTIAFNSPTVPSIYSSFRWDDCI
ncbi:MAG: histidine phosphatase family protein [Leptolyngbyaceae cyanobacterium SL_7_1]|nr:histidine phosphatase family protein [Leptolyngbyaceae cyanobacterium SL_7_1]